MSGPCGAGDEVSFGDGGADEVAGVLVGTDGVDGVADYLTGLEGDYDFVVFDVIAPTTLKSFVVFILSSFVCLNLLGLVTVGDEELLGEGERCFGLLPFGVAGQDVGLDVDQAAGGERVQAGGGVGVGDDGDFYDVAVDGGDGEGDALDGDGTLGDDVLGEGVGKLKAEAPVGGWGGGVDGVEGEEGGGAIDVALDDVSAQGRAGGSGEFEVDDGAFVEVGEGGAGDGLGGEVGREAWGECVGLDAEGGDADSADGDAVASVEAGGEGGCRDGDAGRTCGGTQVAPSDVCSTFRL